MAFLCVNLSESWAVAAKRALLRFWRQRLGVGVGGGEPFNRENLAMRSVLDPYVFEVLVNNLVLLEMPPNCLPKLKLAHTWLVRPNAPGSLRVAYVAKARSRRNQAVIAPNRSIARAAIGYAVVAKQLSTGSAMLS
jgi:hypothetical protein